MTAPTPDQLVVLSIAALEPTQLKPNEGTEG